MLVVCSAVDEGVLVVEGGFGGGSWDVGAWEGGGNNSGRPLVSIKVGPGRGQQFHTVQMQWRYLLRLIDESKVSHEAVFAGVCANLAGDYPGLDAAAVEALLAHGA